MMTLLEDRRFKELGAALDRADTRIPSVRSPMPQKEAAVALVLREGAELEFLLVKRGESERDPWSGHMALPGGRRDASDPNLMATAIRETAEETHVLLDSTWTLGRLRPVSPQSQRLPSLQIHPFVFAAPSGTRAVPERSEIASVHWVPLAHLADPGLRVTVDIPLIGTVRRFPAFELDGQIVWGLTYRILSDFLAALQAKKAG